MSDFYFERRLDKRVLISVIATGILTFTGICAETAMNVIFPTLMKEFSITTSTVQWVTTINLLMLAIIIPTSSWLKKCFLTRHIFMAAIAFFLGGTLLGLWSPSFSVLIIGRVLQGIGTGMALPMMSNIIIEQVPTKNTATIMGCATLTIALGPALGPALGGAIVGIAGWRMIFAALVPFVILSAIGGITCLYQSSAIEKQPFDMKGFLMLALCFSCLLVPLSNISHWGVESPAIWALIAVALIFLWLFKRHCDKRETPLLNLSVLRTSAFSFCLVALLICQFITLARGFMIPNFFQLSNGTSAFIAGCIVLPACIIGAAMNPFAGRIYDAIGPRVPITIGFLLILTDSVLEMFFMRHVSAYVMMAICVLYCLGQSLSTGNTITFSLRNLDPARTADGTAIINTMQQLFGAVGTAVASTVVSFGQGAHPDDIALGTSVGVQWSLYMIFGLAIVMVVCALRGLASGRTSK